MHRLPHPDQAARMTTDELRAAFLVTDLFQPGTVTLRHVDLDRVVLGGAIPTDGPLVLDAPESLDAEYFCERRELGILNIGGPGSVRLDGERHVLRGRDAVYVGRGTRQVVMESDDAAAPACFYLVSYPAHAEHPTTRVASEDAESAELGSQEQANRRRLARYVHPGGVRSAQLVMGVTDLAEGNVWNTMPPHTHDRRTEVYLYFDLPPDAAVIHLMGQPQETRSLVVRDRQVVLSPSWSVHAGCGTRRYAFCWAMGGENQVFSDMQGVAVQDLR